MTETKNKQRHVERHVVCREGDISPGEIRSFTAGGRRLAVMRLYDGLYRAMSDVCPHQGASMGRGSVERMWTSEEPGEMCRDAERSVAELAAAERTDRLVRRRGRFEVDQTDDVGNEVGVHR